MDEVPDAIRRLQADDAYARSIALAGQELMAQMDTEEVAHYCYRMLKGYAAMQKFTPKRDPRSWEVNCEDDLVRPHWPFTPKACAVHTLMGGELRGRPGAPPLAIMALQPSL